MKDIQGIDRGRCNKCRICAEYTTCDGGPVQCVCGHTPSDHETKGTQPAAPELRAPGRRKDTERSRWSHTGRGFSSRDGVTASSCELCPFPGCYQPVEFDLNTGVQGDRCPRHRHTRSFAPNNLPAIGVSPTPSPCVLTPAPTFSSPGAVKCAIQECPNPCFVDASGKAQECCGLTHLMEHQRRLALQQHVVKGLTHCLLPECSRPCWPLMNYCGNSHAIIGKQRGLQVPLPGPSPSGPSVPSFSQLPSSAFPPGEETRRNTKSEIRCSIL